MSAVLTSKPAPRARLSVIRILVALALLAGAFVAGTHVARSVFEPAGASTSAWFAPYVDVTVSPTFDFQDATVNPNPYVVLAFVVASPAQHCEPSWGGTYSLDGAAAQLDLDRRIARVRQGGGDVLVSFGGVANVELARACTDPAALAAAYQGVVTRYGLSAIDLDLEGSSLDDGTAAVRRAAAIATVQAAQRRHGHPLSVWLTLPVSPAGLSASGVAAVDAMLDAHVTLAGVNLMTMDFGASLPAGDDLVAASMAAVDAASHQVLVAYRNAGVALTPDAVYARLGVTPMIGQSDYPKERLDTAAARQLVAEARQRGVSRFSMWSLNRDAKCGGNVAPAIADNFCSGVDQVPLEFSSIFGDASGPLPAADAQPAATVLGGRGATATADATTLPYAQWRPRREYDTGAKVVWDGLVYEAKWWNVSSVPDAPVAHEWDSPWRVLGPVMAKDVPPPPIPRVAPGTYPEWDEATTYYPGDRVEQDGIAYRAKWWTRGDDPGADVDNAWESPWEAVAAPNPDP